MPPPLRAAAALDISYRSSIDGDLPLLAVIYASTRTEELAVTGWPPEVKRRFLQQQSDAQHRHYRAHHPGAEWLVIERAGEPVGRLYLAHWTDQIRIIDIALLPAQRGGGIGAAILSDIIDHARADGRAVSIHVERTNPAMRLYARLGFVRVEDHGIYDLMEWRASPA